jgi:hypothetical protein
MDIRLLFPLLCIPHFIHVFESLLGKYILLRRHHFSHNPALEIYILLTAVELSLPPPLKIHFKVDSEKYDRV